MPFGWMFRLAAAAAHAVVAEYRKLDPPAAAPAAAPARTELNCTSAQTSPRWQPNTAAPASARLGFTLPGPVDRTGRLWSDLSEIEWRRWMPGEPGSRP